MLETQPWGGQLKPPVGSQIIRGHPYAPDGAFWGMPEGAGNTLYDLTGQGNNATLIGGPAWNAVSQVGPGLTFNGSSQYATIPVTTSMSMSQPITVIFWASLTSTAVNYICTLYNPSSPFTGWAMSIGNPTAGAPGYWNSIRNIWVGAGSGKTVNDGLLHQIAMTVAASGTVSFYKDGLLLGTASSDVPVVYSGQWYLFRNSSAGNYWNGKAYSLSVYRRALSASDIASLYPNPYQFVAASNPKFFSLPASGFVYLQDASGASGAGRVITSYGSLAGDISTAKMPGRSQGTDQAQLADLSTVWGPGRSAVADNLMLSDLSAAKASGRSATVESLSQVDLSAARSAGRDMTVEILALSEESFARAVGLSAGFDAITSVSYADRSTVRLVARTSAVEAVLSGMTSGASGIAGATGNETIALPDLSVLRFVGRATGIDNLITGGVSHKFTPFIDPATGAEFYAVADPSTGQTFFATADPANGQSFLIFIDDTTDGDN